MKNNITLKELFERIVQLETKLDMKTENDKIVAGRFKNFSFIIITIQLVNILIAYLTYILLK